MREDRFEMRKPRDRIASVDDLIHREKTFLPTAPDLDQLGLERIERLKEGVHRLRPPTTVEQFLHIFNMNHNRRDLPLNFAKRFNGPIGGPEVDRLVDAIAPLGTTGI